MLKRIPEQPPKIAVYNGNDVIIWSIMIPVFNCFNYLEDTLISVLNQDYNINLTQIEVVDDCSTDGDVEKLVNEIGQGRVRYFRQKENVGSLRNFETCLNRSKGKYIHLLHGDDTIEYGFYNEIETLFNEYPEAGAAFTNFHYINNENSIVAVKNESVLDYSGVIPNFVEKIAEKQLVQPPAMVVKRTTYETLGGFFAVHFGEDWEMWTRIASKFPIAYSPKYLANYRVSHGVGISHNSFRTGQNVEDIRKVIDIIQNYLPLDKRIGIKKSSSEYYAKYCIKVANGLLLDNKEAAFRQIKGAWSMSRSFNILLWIIRFYAMYILRYKQIEKFWVRTKKHIMEEFLIPTMNEQKSN
ncbi:glycosyltransferase [Mariniflexile sp.]|uniref:glycosyltransferase n=1 Tax=Mariniflexile sp. TaxID=1979402 RepID=UPI0035670F29